MQIIRIGQNHNVRIIFLDPKYLGKWNQETLSASLRSVGMTEIGYMVAIDFL